MQIKELLQDAEQLKAEIITDRRTLHQNPEAGPRLPETAGYVKRQLEALGYPAQELAGGVAADITGEDTGRCILLRADMDALRIREDTGLEFQSENGKMHACGHDLHAAMLLGAARLLRQHREELQGTVRLVFPPDPEGFTGAKAMLAAGILKKKPEPPAALALHVHSGTPSGLALCGRGTFMAGCTLFRITVQGVGCHGAMPENAVDPVPAMAELITAIHMLPTREVSSMENCVISIGQVELPGSVWNVVPERAHIVGGFRTFNNDVRALLRQRIPELAEGIAKANRCTAVCTQTLGYDATINDEAMALEGSRTLENIVGEGNVILTNKPFMGSEDFGCFTQHVPGVLFWLGTGTGEDDKPLHNPYFKMDLQALPVGTACHVQNALHFLK